MLQDVQKLQSELEAHSALMVEGLRKQLASVAIHLPLLEEVVRDNADAVMRRFWALSDQLIMQYSNGYCNGCAHPATEGGNARHLGYPRWWLDKVYEAPVDVPRSAELEMSEEVITN